VQQPVSWHDLLPKLSDRLAAASQANPDGIRFLLSAHASHEELFLFRRLAEAARSRSTSSQGAGAASGADAREGDNGSTSPINTITVSWRTTDKQQPPQTKFKVPDVDAPNVNGARMLGLVAESDGSESGLLALRAAVQAGQVAVLYVFDPGPDGSIGDTSWIVNARAEGKLPVLIVQGVLLTDLARAADFVLPGASFVEKEASYTNDQGRLQITARAIPTPGEALEDWQILVNLGAALGVPLEYRSASDVRAAIEARFPAITTSTLSVNVAMPAQHWFESSNPSERWKWDFMFQDLPPVKGTVDPSALPPPPGTPPGMIHLKEVK
jgi:hypothetical protein